MWLALFDCYVATDLSCTRSFRIYVNTMLLLEFGCFDSFRSVCADVTAVLNEVFSLEIDRRVLYNVWILEQSSNEIENELFSVKNVKFILMKNVFKLNLRTVIWKTVVMLTSHRSTRKWKGQFHMLHWNLYLPVHSM